MSPSPRFNVNQSQLVVDLSQNDSLRALARLHCGKSSMRKKVKSVLVHIHSCVWTGHASHDSGGSCCISDLHHHFTGSVDDSLNSLKPEAMKSIFSILGSLLNLRTLTIELEDRSLPVDALVAVLEGAKRLKNLHLSHLTLNGGDCQTLQKALRKHSSLEHIMLVHVRGTFAVQAFLTQLPNVQSIALVGSAICTVRAVTASTLITACQSSTLRSLRLEGVPDINNEQVQALAAALLFLPSLSTKLNEFHLISDNLGDIAGQAMAQLLQTTSFLKVVTLRLGGWSQCGRSMANVLAQNDTMTSLDVLISARTQHSVNAKTASVFHALKNNTTLRELKVCQSSSSVAAELDTHDDSSSNNNDSNRHCHNPKHQWNAGFLKSLEDTLERNHTLETVTLVDDSFYPIQLSSSVQSQLEYNRVGLSSLLDGSDESHDAIYNRENYYKDYVEAIIKANTTTTSTSMDMSSNLDLVFTALLNNPMLFTTATTTPTSSLLNNTASSSSLSSSTIVTTSHGLVEKYRISPTTRKAGKMIRQTVLRMRKPLSWKQTAIRR